MRNMKRALAAVAACFVATGAFGAGDVELEPAGNDVDNIQSLQRGARNFMSYCSGCHGAEYVRYNSIARGLELSEDQVADNLMFNAEKTFETVVASMPRDDAARWFGIMPPDMSLIARSKGTDYIYNFLKGFYVEPGSPTGVNNRVQAGSSMPNVLWELQGLQEAVYREEPAPGSDGATVKVFERFEPVTAGMLNAEEFDNFVRDTVNFLEYISEPERSTRRTIGTWVLIYLAVFMVIAVMLKKQIWKDVK